VKSKTTSLQYSVAILATAIALLLTQLSSFWLHPTMSAFFFAAVAVSTWYGGMKPGIVATVLSVLAIDYFFTPPINQFSVNFFGDFIRLGIFSLVATIINLLNMDLRRSREKIERLSQQLLQESAQKLSMALSAARMGMWDWNMLTGKIVWNQEHEQLFGLAPDTFDGRYETFDACLHPDDKNALEEAVNRAIRDRNIFQHEYRVIWADGSIHWMEGRGQAFYDETDRPVQMMGTVMDITPRKQAEEALQKQEERWQLAIKGSNDGIWDHDLLTNKHYLSPRCREILGYSDEEITTFDEWFSLIYPDDQEVLRKRFQAHLNHETAYYWCEYRMRCKDGTYKWLLARGQALWNEQGVPIRAVGSLKDISDRKASETDLRESERRYSSLAAAAPVGIFRTDPQGNCLYVNQRWCQIAGLSVDRAMGTGWVWGLHSEDRDRVVQDWYDAVENNVMFRSEYRFKHPDGTVTWVFGQAVAQRSLSGKIIGYIGTITDISDRKQAEAELQALNAQLEQRIRQRTAELSCINQQLTQEIQVRQQAEIELQRQIAEVSDLYNNAPCGYHSLDADGFFIRINDTELRWLGYTRDEILYKKKFSDLITAESVEVFQENFPQFKLQGWIDNLEFEIIRKDGTIFSVNVNATAIYDAQGNYLMSRSTVFDLSDRKRTEILLRRREEEFRALVENAPDIIARFDRNLRYIYINPVIEKESGIPPSAFLGKTVRDMGFSEEIAAMMEQTANAVLTTKQEQRHEFQAPPFDPPFEDLKFYQARLVPLFDAQGEVESVLTISRDITTQKKTEATLREANRRWHSLIENVQLVVVGLDNTGKVNYVNPFFLKITGYEQSEVLGKDWVTHFLPATDREQLNTAFEELLEHNYHTYYENPILTKFAEERLLAWNNTVLRDLQGHSIGTLSIAEDITERHAIEQIKAEFISIISHELRTPLTSIYGSLGLLATGIYDKKPEKGKRMIEIALTDCERLVRLVNDILDLERLESGKVALVKETCDVASLMQQAAQSVQAIADHANITLTLTPLSTQIQAAPDAIIQTLTNLLSNAIKFSPPNSAIALSAELRSNAVLFQVKDQGKGIPYDKLETIFGRFQQVDLSDSRQKGGTGLGLAICKSIVEQHGGRIWVSSILGQGSTFSFTLPIDE
jgi:PAS domain S-box-containing protein